jgi:predicted GNAT superfamily acetyltransferase
VTQPPPHSLAIRPIDAIEDLHACEAIAKVVWQVDDREIVPASHLRAIQHAGGLAAGAFDGGRLVGFVIGVLARHAPAEPTGLHSHLMGVLPEYRRAGVGRALKRFQRAWCLERDLPWVTWTFDPLQATHARRNLEQLGAEAVAYHADFYGRLGGVQFGSLPTDRLVARWQLAAPRVVRLAAGEGPDPAPAPAPAALATAQDGGPGTPRSDLDLPAVRVEVPADFAPLLYHDPARAQAWRLAVRAAMEAYMARGYRARRFLDGGYRLERAT